MKLKMLFYKEMRINHISLAFNYDFTQHENLAEEQVHTLTNFQTLQVKSDSPFRITWGVITSNPFLSSLQQYAKENKANLKVRKSSKSIFPVTRLAFQEIVDAL